MCLKIQCRHFHLVCTSIAAPSKSSFNLAAIFYLGDLNAFFLSYYHSFTASNVHVLMANQNLQVQQVNELPNSAEVIASWDNGDIPTEESSVCQLSITPEPPTDSQTPEPSRDSPQPEVANDLGARAGSRSANSKAKGRKRPASTNFEELISLHKQAEQRAAKASKKIYKLHKTFIKLQAESNDMQASMIRMLEKYLVPNDQ